MIFLNVPGYGNSSAGHWHTWLEHTFRGFQRAEQDDWLDPQRDVWLDRLDQTICSLDDEVFLIGHSCGAVVTAQWLAERDRGNTGVVGAILVAPADVENAEHLPAIQAQAPLPYSKFRIPSLVLASSNDPHCPYPRSEQFAQAWGSDLICIGDVGHIATDDGFGQWTEIAWLIEERSGQELKLR